MTASLTRRYRELVSDHSRFERIHHSRQIASDRDVAACQFLQDADALFALVAANAAAKHKGSIFEILYRRYVPRLGHDQTIGIIAHKLCRLVWKILHRGIRYEERGQEVSKASKQKRARKMIQALRRLGYRIESPPPQPSQAQAQ